MGKKKAKRAPAEGARATGDELADETTRGRVLLGAPGGPDRLIQIEFVDVDEAELVALANALASSKTVPPVPDDDTLRTFMAGRVRRARQALCVSVAELAAWAGIGEAAVRHVEAGRSFPSERLLWLLASETDPRFGWGIGWYYGLGAIHVMQARPRAMRRPTGSTDEADQAARLRERIAAGEIKPRSRELLRVEAAAARLDLGLTTAWRLVREGKLEVDRTASATRVVAASVDAFKATDEYSRLRSSGRSARTATPRDLLAAAISTLAEDGGAPPELVAEALDACETWADRLSAKTLPA